MFGGLASLIISLSITASPDEPPCIVRLIDKAVAPPVTIFVVVIPEIAVIVYFFVSLQSVSNRLTLFEN
jgi:hypothetical protein